MDTLLIFLGVTVGMIVFSHAAGNPAQHSRHYRLRRLLNWLPLGLTYAFLYMGRYNLTVAQTALHGLMTKQDFGVIFGAGAWTYALAFLINGPLTDRIGGKRAIMIGAAGVTVMNTAMGLLTYFILNRPDLDINLRLTFTIIYAMNMYFQSYGAVAIVKVNSSWFHVRERGTFGGLFGVLISLGLYFAFDWSQSVVDATQKVAPATLGPFQELLRWLLVPAAPTQSLTWWVFFLPAVILFFFFLLVLLLVRDRPSQAGFADFETGDASAGEADRPFSLGEILKKILTNPIILTIAFIEFCSGVMRNGIMHWYKIFVSEHGAAAQSLISQHWGLTQCLAGITGGMVAGFISDKIFGSRRGPVAALLYAAMLVLAVVMVFTLRSPLTLGIVVALMSMAVIGVHGMLSGTATMDFGGRRAAGTAVGIIDGFVYLGTGLQSLSLGYIASRDWSYWPVFLIPFSLIGLLLAVRIWRAFPGPAKAPAQAAAPAATTPAAAPEG